MDSSVTSEQQSQESRSLAPKTLSWLDVAQVYAFVLLIVLGCSVVFFPLPQSADQTWFQDEHSLFSLRPHFVIHDHRHHRHRHKHRHATHLRSASHEVAHTSGKRNNFALRRASWTSTNAQKPGTPISTWACPEVVTQKHLAEPAMQKDGYIRGRLENVVQWKGYPYEEEAVAGILRSSISPESKHQMEFGEDLVPVLGTIGLENHSLMQVFQRQDHRRLEIFPPIKQMPTANPDNSSSDTLDFYIEGIRLSSQKDAALTLYAQGDLKPFHWCDGNCSYKFRMHDRGGWFVAVATPSSGPPEIQRLFVSLPVSCPAEQFSRKELTCAPLPARLAQLKMLGELGDLLADAHTPPLVSFKLMAGGAVRLPFTPEARPELSHAFLRYFSGNRTDDTYRQIEQVYSEQNFSSMLKDVQACLSKASGGHFSAWNLEKGQSGHETGETDDVNDLWSMPLVFKSPEPDVLHGTDGFREAVGALTVLRSMGTQSLRANMNHLDVIMRPATAPYEGANWTNREIFRLWVGWARYQYAIDQLLPTLRVQNKLAQGLYAWDPKVQYVFQNFHQLMRSQHAGEASLAELCRRILGDGECDASSDRPSNHTPLRFYALNLAPLNVTGSVEVRQFTSSICPLRFARWLDFALRAVDAFRRDDSLDRFFNHTADEDLKQLHSAQAQASLDDLFNAVNLPQSSRDYFAHRAWAKKPGSSSFLHGCLR